MGPKEWRRGGGGRARCRRGAAKAIGDLLCGRHCGKGGRSAAPRAPPKKRASTPKAETTPSRKSSRAGSEHKPGMYAISARALRWRRSPRREEKEQARLEKLLKRADRAVANAVADDAKHANRERRHEDARRHALEQAVLQEQRRILFQHQAILRAQQLEVLRQQRVQEREERERQAMAAMAARDARRAAKFVKEMAKSQRSTELQRQRVESKVYRESPPGGGASSRRPRSAAHGRAPAGAGAGRRRRRLFAPPFAAGGAPAPWGAYDGAGAFAAASYAHAGYGGFEPPYAADYDRAATWAAAAARAAAGGAALRLRVRVLRRRAGAARRRRVLRAGRAAEPGGLLPRRGAPAAAPPPQQLTAADVARLLPPCCFCGGANDPDSAEGAMIASVFLGPREGRRPRARCAHERCAELSPEVFLDDHGAYHNVVKAAKRGAQLRCFACDGRARDDRLPRRELPAVVPRALRRELALALRGPAALLARRRPGEVTLTCEGCAGEFHPNAWPSSSAAPPCARRAGSLEDDDGDDGQRKPLRPRCRTASGPSPSSSATRPWSPSPRRRPRRPAARMTRPATRRTRRARRAPTRPWRGAGGRRAAVAEAPADADAAMAEAPADATVEVADAEPPVADAMEDDSEAPLDV
ncbi:DNA binding protein [Aureococcus anophagefferens]|uniref:DNA binding protein n=1 Tax=Aureococcus anophagefferens TaxID=44056 RepID=A0ABR1GCE8_AURAN